MVILDPHAVGFLARMHLGGDNNNIATYINDTFPRVAPAGQNVGDQLLF